MLLALSNTLQIKVHSQAGHKEIEAPSMSSAPGMVGAIDLLNTLVAGRPLSLWDETSHHKDLRQGQPGGTC